MAVSGFVNSLGSVFNFFRNTDSRKQNNAVKLGPSKLFTGEFPSIVPKIVFIEKYDSWPQIKAATNSTAKKIMGSDIEISTKNESFTEFLEEWCRIVSFKRKINQFILNTIITGDGFIELQFTDDGKLGNIEVIPSTTFFKINRDMFGQVLSYVQNVDGILNELSPTYIVQWSINNPNNEAFGKSEFYSVAAPRPLVGEVDPITQEQINPTRFVAPVLDMQARNLHAEMEYKEKMAKGRIIIKAKDMPEEQLKQLKSEMNDPSSEKTFWAFNVQDKEDITVEEASISKVSGLDRYTDNMNREVDLATQISSKIATDPGSFSFASSQTPLQELAERITADQTDLAEIVQERIFRILALNQKVDFDEVQPQLNFKPFIKKIDLEQLNQLDPTRISDKEYRDAIRDIITLDDQDFEKQKEEKLQQMQEQQDKTLQQSNISGENVQRNTEQSTTDKDRPTTENYLRNPALVDRYIEKKIANEIRAISSVGAGGETEPLNSHNQNTSPKFLQPLNTDPPQVTDEDVSKKLDETDTDDDDDDKINGKKSTETKSYEGKFAGFDTLEECVENNQQEDDPIAYCRLHQGK